jgi:hypothetical protein
MSESETVEVPRSLVEELADQHKSVARFGYERNKTAMADEHHSWARRLNEATDRDWKEVGDNE